MSRWRSPRWWAAALVVAALACCVNTEVRGDGNGYYAWIASAVVDGDLDFRNQYRHGNQLFFQWFDDGVGGFSEARMTRTGHIDNQWAVGTAALWAPWFLGAHAVVRLRGLDPQDGYAPIYRRACALGSFCYAMLALWLGARAARRFGVPAHLALASAIVVCGATSLLVYTWLLPFYAHAAGAFTVALFLTGALVADRTPLTMGQWAWWGASAGLMAMTYLANGLFGVVALPVWLAVWRRDGAMRAISAGAVFVGAAVVAALPHLIGKALVYGSPFVTGYQEHWYFTAPQLWATAFSPNHGVFLWTPLMAVGLIGCAFLVRRHRSMVAMLVAAALFYELIASYGNWHGLSSFGNRFFTAWTLLVVVGVGVVLQRLGATALGRRASLLMAAALVLWNVSLAFQWASKMIPNRGPVDVAVVLRQQQQVPALAWTYGWRYFTDRARLARDIEERDWQEWQRTRIPQ